MRFIVRHHNSPPHLARWMEWMYTFHCALPSRSSSPDPFCGSVAVFMFVFTWEIKRIKRAPVTLFSTNAAAFFFFFLAATRKPWRSRKIGISRQFLLLLRGELIAAVAPSVVVEPSAAKESQNQLSIPRASVHGTPKSSFESNYYYYRRQLVFIRQSAVHVTTHTLDALKQITNHPIRFRYATQCRPLSCKTNT